MEGHYGQFLAPYAHDSTRMHAALLTRVLASAHSVPKVFLSLVEHGGVYRSVSVHRLTLYANHQYEPSPWDNLVLGFGGDVLPGNHIELLCFPGNAFEVTGTQVVPTLAGMHALLAATPPLQHRLGHSTTETSYSFTKCFAGPTGLHQHHTRQNPDPSRAMGPARRLHHRRWKGRGMSTFDGVAAHGPHSTTGGHNHRSTPRSP